MRKNFEFELEFDIDIYQIFMKSIQFVYAHVRYYMGTTNFFQDWENANRKLQKDLNIKELDKNCFQVICFFIIIIIISYISSELPKQTAQKNRKTLEEILCTKIRLQLYPLTLKSGNNPNHLQSTNQNELRIYMLCISCTHVYFLQQNAKEHQKKYQDPTSGNTISTGINGVYH